MQKIDWNEMFKYTGDPFVDAGGFVLQELMECYPDVRYYDVDYDGD